MLNIVKLCYFQKLLTANHQYLNKLKCERSTLGSIESSFLVRIDKPWQFKLRTAHSVKLSKIWVKVQTRAPRYFAGLSARWVVSSSRGTLKKLFSLLQHEGMRIKNSWRRSSALKKQDQSYKNIFSRNFKHSVWLKNGCLPWSSK